MGLFSKEDSSPEFAALVERWDGFLKKLEARYYEVLQQAEEPLAGVIDGLQYDTIVINNVLMGLKNQTVDQLSEKAEGGWGKMEAEMEKIGVSRDSISKERDKMDVFKNWLGSEFQVYEVKTYSRAAQKVLENVQKHIDLNKLHKCTQCAAELPINTYSFVAINIKCDSCGSVNTYQPDDRIRALEHYVINKFAEERALPAKMKPEGDKEAQKEYYRLYYGYLMENVPDKKEFYERQMNERIKWVDNPPDYVKDMGLK